MSGGSDRSHTKGVRLLLSIVVLGLVALLVTTMATPRLGEPYKAKSKKKPNWAVLTLQQPSLGITKARGVSGMDSPLVMRKILGCEDIRNFQVLGQVACAYKKKNPASSITNRLRTKLAVSSIEDTEGRAEKTCKRSTNTFCTDLDVLTFLNKTLDPKNQETNSLQKVEVNRPEFYSCNQYAMRAFQLASDMGKEIVSGNGDSGAATLERCKRSAEATPSSDENPASPSILETPVSTISAPAAESLEVIPTDDGGGESSGGGIDICGNGIKEGAEVCDGGACCTPSCATKPAGTVCDNFTGAKCTGASADCPTNSLPAGISYFKGSALNGSCLQ